MRKYFQEQPPQSEHIRDGVAKPAEKSVAAEPAPAEQIAPVVPQQTVSPPNFFSKAKERALSTANDISAVPMLLANILWGAAKGAWFFLKFAVHLIMPGSPRRRHLLSEDYHKIRDYVSKSWKGASEKYKGWNLPLKRFAESSLLSGFFAHLSTYFVTYHFYTSEQAQKHSHFVLFAYIFIADEIGSILGEVVPLSVGYKQIWGKKLSTMGAFGKGLGKSVRIQLRQSVSDIGIMFLKFTSATAAVQLGAGSIASAISASLPEIVLSAATLPVKVAINAPLIQDMVDAFNRIRAHSHPKMHQEEGHPHEN